VNDLSITDKQKIIEQTIETLQRKKAQLISDINEIKEAQANETKSSAGDKYETSREIQATEMTKLANQVRLIEQHLFMCDSISTKGTPEAVSAGSLVACNTGLFLIGIPLGKLDYENRIIFGISQAAPIAQALLNHKTGDRVDFQNREIEIISIL